jgi:hypothetical protein
LLHLAGVTAGIDLTLALVEEDLGRAIALRLAQMMVAFLRRPGGQSQFSATLAAQYSENYSLGDLIAWLPDNLTADLSIEKLARPRRDESPEFCPSISAGDGQNAQQAHRGASARSGSTTIGVEFTES